jgi:hydroxysqualene dehydroxylase
MSQRVVVIGGGWAGISAAVCSVQAGFSVSIKEMAPELGGRARTVTIRDREFDNGQHILIGAYSQTLALMSLLGVPIEQTLQRTPFAVRYPDGTGIALPLGATKADLLFAAVLARGWRARDRAALIAWVTVLAARGFSCPAHWTVDRLCSWLPCRVRGDLIDPLCFAALNTPPSRASASTFLRVLKDTLLGAPGSSDLLIPKVGLTALLPGAAVGWLTDRGAQVQTRKRAMQISRAGSKWCVDDEAFDQVILACTATEAARLVADISPAWAAGAASLDHESIVTVYLRAGQAKLPIPMMALANGPNAPAQFIFDHGALGAELGTFACVVSAPQQKPTSALYPFVEGCKRQLRETLSRYGVHAEPLVLAAIEQKRATFSCAPSLQRPATTIADGLFAAGDYVDGPYPATLEGAVRSGAFAAAQVVSFCTRQESRGDAGIPTCENRLPALIGLK